MHCTVRTCLYRIKLTLTFASFTLFVSGQVDKLSYAALAEVKRHQVPVGWFLWFACDPTELSSIKSLHEEMFSGDESKLCARGSGNHVRGSMQKGLPQKTNTPHKDSHVPSTVQSKSVEFLFAEGSGREINSPTISGSQNCGRGRLGFEEIGNGVFATA